MGVGIARIDAAVVRDVAREFDDTAAILDAAVRSQMSALDFGGAVAGRAYAAHGDALRAAVQRIADGLTEWSRASAEISAALRASADRYLGADERAAERFG